MKRLILIALILCSTLLLGSYLVQQEAKPSNYSALWKKVEAYESKGLPKSAAQVVDTIFTKARREKNQPQFIKALLHKSKYMSYLLEKDEDILEVTGLYEKEIKNAAFPGKAILQSALAEYYFYYYRQNSYQIRERTPLEKNEGNILSWDIKSFAARISELYDASLSDAEALKKIKVRDYQAILLTAKGSEKIRPTLFDLLTHRAIEYYQGSYSDVFDFGNELTLNDKDLFASAENFAGKRFPGDPASVKFKALKLYQALTSFHLNDKEGSRLIHLDEQRIRFAASIYKGEDADALQAAAMLRAAERFPKNPESAFMLAQLANFYKDSYDSLIAKRTNKIKAVELSRQVIKSYPNSVGAKICQNLLDEITYPSFSLKTEAYAVADKASLAQLRYTNNSTAYIRIIETNPLELLQANSDPKRRLSTYLSKKPLNSLKIELPPSKNYYEKSAEISLPALPLGYYVILISGDKDFSTKGNNSVYQGEIQSSNATLNILQKNKPGEVSYQVKNSVTGEPLPGITAEMIHLNYDYKKKEYKEILIKTLLSDAKGEFTSQREQNEVYTYNIRLKKDGKFLGYFGNLYNYGNAETPPVETQSIVFFTDRSIYRPGQSVHYKGINTVRKGNYGRAEIVANREQKIVFRDMNYRELATTLVKTNEFGSFSGSFEIPLAGNTGVFTIIAEGISSYASINVEEYKRPKFEVKLSPPAGVSRFNDTVHVGGNAKAYAGNALDNALVLYTVKRKANYPYWENYFKPMPNSTEMLISRDTLYTKADGSFDASFVAIPPADMDRESRVKYSYQVDVSVTDINGETRHASSVVQVANYGLEAEIKGLPLYFDIKDKPQIVFQVNNINGQAQAFDGEMTIEKMIADEQHFYRPDIFDESDTSLLSESERQSIPQYRSRSKLWDDLKAADEVLRVKFQQALSPKYTLPDLSSMGAGHYRLTFYTRDGAEMIRQTKIFELIDTKAKKLSYRSAFEMKQLSGSTLKPGEKLRIFLASSHENSKLTYYIESKGKIVAEENVVLNNESRLLEIPVREEYRGNFYVHVNMLRENRLYTEKINVHVPWYDKEPEITLSTFRDKMLPGEKQEWKVTMKGNDGEKLAAEMLLSMYDASLDQFKEHSWTNEFQAYEPYSQCSFSGFAGKSNNAYAIEAPTIRYNQYELQQYDALNWFGALNVGDGYTLYEVQAVRANLRKRAKTADKREYKFSVADAVAAPVAAEAENQMVADSVSTEAPEELPGSTAAGVKARSDFRETVFFYPQLRTNEKGEVSFSFSMPEALTRWRFMALGHSKDLRSDFHEQFVTTSKTLMLQPNLPRFLREEDEIVLSAKVVNTDSVELENIAVDLELRNVETNELILHGINVHKMSASKIVNLAKNSSANVEFRIKVPSGVNVISALLKAKSARYEDAELNALPVLKNSMLVTESQPIWSYKKGEKSFNFEKLLNSGNSNTLKHHRVTLEFSSNPAWYAVLALPYLMEYPYECSEQIFSRFYANSVAMKIANSNPRIKEIYNTWKNLKSSNALMSNLEKNQELKSLLLEETPWVAEGNTESENKRRIALLFDENNLKNSLAISAKKLSQLQRSSGAWPWFGGMGDDPYITALIVTGSQRLKRMGAQENLDAGSIHNANQYLLEYLRRDYENLKKSKQNMDKYVPANLHIQILYAFSYFNPFSPGDAEAKAIDYFRKRAAASFLQYNRMTQGMIALTEHRAGNKKTADAILRSLSEFAIHNEEMGMYWKDNNGGWYWYEAPVETQSVLIEAYDEIAADIKSVQEMKTWLLRNKQTSNWRSTRATADACYAILMKGMDEISEPKRVDLYLDDKLIIQNNAEVGTGYIKESFTGAEVKAGMGKIRINKWEDGLSWGAVYWQYHERLDKISSATNTGLKLNKEVYKVVGGKKGEELQRIDVNSKVRQGDRIRVRIILSTDRYMEYIHLKDMRAAGFEPVNVLSGYKYRQGLSYYESTRDAATNFFISSMGKGTYVFEYDLMASNAGIMQNGIATIQCMYAPEFTSNSAGMTIRIEN